MKEIILIGGGGHCKSVIEVIESKKEFRIAGIIDTNLKTGTEVSGYKVIGNDKDIAQIADSFDTFIIAIGSIKTAIIRKQQYLKLKAYGVKFPWIAASTSYVSDRSGIGDGTVIMHKAFVNAAARIGENCIINTGAIVEHDVTVGNHTHISTAAVLNGHVTVGDECFIGSNAVIKEGVVIGNNAIIGAGAVVLKDVADNAVITGTWTGPTGSGDSKGA